MKHLDDPIRSRTRDLPACSAVPPSTPEDRQYGVIRNSWGGNCTFLINVLFSPSFLLLTFALAGLNLSFRDERLPFLSPTPSTPIKKQLLISTVAQRTRRTAAVYSWGRAVRPSNYHFKLFHSKSSSVLRCCSQKVQHCQSIGYKFYLHTS